MWVPYAQQSKHAQMFVDIQYYFYRCQQYPSSITQKRSEPGASVALVLRGREEPPVTPWLLVSQTHGDSGRRTGFRLCASLPLQCNAPLNKMLRYPRWVKAHPHLPQILYPSSGNSTFLAHSTTYTLVYITSKQFHPPQNKNSYFL